MERGEVQGRCGWSWSSIKATRPNWVASKKIIVLVQMSLSKHPELPDVPLIMDLAKTDEQRQIFKMIFARQVMGRPYLAPPGIPADRLAALRQAFMDTMTDKEFLADAEKNKFEINPVNGEQIEALVKEVYQTPPEVDEKSRRGIGVIEASKQPRLCAQRREQIAKERRRPRHLQRPVKHDPANERSRRGRSRATIEAAARRNRNAYRRKRTRAIAGMNPISATQGDERGHPDEEDRSPAAAPHRRSRRDRRHASRGMSALTFMPKSACATSFCSGPNSSLTRLSTAATSAMPQAVSGTSLASCGQSADEMIAATMSTMIASEKAGRGAEPRLAAADVAQLRDRASSRSAKRPIQRPHHAERGSPAPPADTASPSRKAASR